MFEKWRTKKIAAVRGDTRAFSVDDVSPASTSIPTETLQASLTRRFQREVVLLPEPTKAVINPLLAKLPENRRSADFAGSRLHPLIDAIHCAFSSHYPLTLTPDAIWLVIAQGFSHHVQQNAEALRGRLVRHEGVKTLTADITSLTLDEFEKGIASFSAQIRDASDPVLHETLVCDFSTTSFPIRTASEIVLMDTYSSYFRYSLACVCGIPRITLAGNPEDWLRIRDRVEVLETYGLEWWISRLRPILDEFVRTADGAPNLEFWQAIYKPKATYGATCATGWITDLFPYLGEAPNRQRSHVFQYERKRWSMPPDKGVNTRNPMFDPGARKGVSLKSFPSGLASVPVKITLMDGSKHNVDLVGGYFAVEQNSADLSLAPIISWAVTEPPPALPVHIWA